MSRIVVFEVPDKSDVTMRDMLMKLKELDESIEARVTMPFEHWAELLKDDIHLYPMFLPKEKNIKKIGEWLQKQRTTSIEDREK